MGPGTQYPFNKDSMTCTGLLTAISFWSFAAMMAYLLWERRKVYQNKTIAFFSFYTAFLFLRGYNTLGEHFTEARAAVSMISLTLLIPMMIFMWRVMRTGDPFEISNIVSNLRQQLRDRDDLDAKRAEIDHGVCEQLAINKRMDELDHRIEDASDQLMTILKIKRSGNNE